MTLTNTELKDIMYNKNISVVELSHYTGYNSKYITGLRSGRYPITDSFKVALITYLTSKKKMEMEDCIKLVKLGGGYE